MTSRDFSQDATLKRNLKRALSEYLAEASPCRCAPCHNNGLAVLRGTSEDTDGGNDVGDIADSKGAVFVSLDRHQV